MLGALRSSAKSWVAKILLLLLVASFAVWGVSGQITSGVGGNTVLTAGDTTVSADEYRLAYDRTFRGLQAQFGPSLTREQARLFGAEQQVLSQLAAGAVLDEQARVMRLGLTREGLAEVISEDAQNWGGGNFDRATLQLVLRQLGMTEEQYVSTLESVAVRQQLVDATVNGTQAPDVFLDALFAHRGESRDVSFIRIDESALPAIDPPSDAILNSYFADNSDNYRAPEYREIRYVRLTPEEIADPSSVAASTVRAEYDTNRARFGEAEQRTIQQIVFSDRPAAEEARQRLLAGESFEDVVAETGRTMADVTLGTLTRDAIADPAIAEAAFALGTENEISPVIDGAFGPILVRATEIIEERVQPFEEVEEELRQDLAIVEANDILLNVHDGYEDARAGGQSMREAAAAQRLEVITIDAVDREGLDPEGNRISAPEEIQDLLRESFESDVLVENTPLAAGRGGFLWYEVVDVTPDRDRTLDEVRDRVIADWIDEQEAEQLDTEAERIANALEGGQDIQALAEETSYETDRRLGLSRSATDGTFNAETIAAVFAAGPDGVGTAPTSDGDGRFVFVVDTITHPLGNAEALDDNERIRTSSALADDILDQMVGRAQREFSVTVNPTAIERAQQAGL